MKKKGRKIVDQEWEKELIWKKNFKEQQER